MIPTKKKGFLARVFGGGADEPEAIVPEPAAS